MQHATDAGGDAPLNNITDAADKVIPNGVHDSIEDDASDAAEEDLPTPPISSNDCADDSQLVAEVILPKIILTEESDDSQTVAVSEDDENTFPEVSVISNEPAVPATEPDNVNDDQTHTVNAVTANGQISTTSANSNSLATSSVVETDGSDQNDSSTVTEGVSGTPSTSPTSPSSMTKKRGFWAKFAIIFKPWKWRRKKRSKKLEKSAVGMY